MRDEKGRFLPGQSGNRFGRPPSKEAVITEILKEKIDPVALADKLIEMAMSGDMAAIRYIYDRVDGKPRETIKQTVQNMIPTYVGFRSIHDEDIAQIEDDYDKDTDYE